MEPALPDSILVDFLGRLLADRAAGGTRTLADYQALYPGHEGALESEYQRATSQDETLHSRDRSARDDANGADPDAPRVAHYRLVRELGRGGQGTVWLARDERLNRSVALKLVPRSPLVEDLAPRFRREAQLAGRLDHPGICAVYDVGCDDSVAWMALRFVEGVTLARRIAAGPLPREEALSLLEGAARALHVAHEGGIVHRDVKPANLMITPAGEPVVLDFGVARPDEDGPPLTLTGDAIGTPAYMAPEQVGSARAPRLADGSARMPDRRVDVWALGVTLFEALTGRRPFAAPTREGLVHAIVAQEPELPRSLGRDLCVVIATALAKDADRRYRTALDLADDLRRVRRREPILARPAGPGTRLWSWSRRNRRLAASLFALAVVIVGALAVTFVLLARTRETLADVTRLADQKLARDLLASEQALWPAAPERQAAFSAWLGEARAVLAREPLHCDVLAAAAAGTGLTDSWMREQLDQLLLELAKLAVSVENVQHRLEFARDVDRITLEEPRAAWEAAAAAVAADPRFDGLLLRPQRGLLPIGADPDAGLQEFALVQSGTVPERDPQTRKLA
ncbi:MAG TPA: serine/threonine-protein kinase, partial [Planctomycetota bacterium]|nr:serine/threonine-protein kinase [Planctomycetota bacterium]